MYMFIWAKRNIGRINQRLMRLIIYKTRGEWGGKDRLGRCGRTTLLWMCLCIVLTFGSMFPILNNDSNGTNKEKKYSQHRWGKNCKTEYKPKKLIKAYFKWIISPHWGQWGSTNPSNFWLIFGLHVLRLEAKTLQINTEVSRLLFHRNRA